MNTNVKKRLQIVATAILLMAVFGMIASAAICERDCGTKVEQCDVETVHRLCKCITYDSEIVISTSGAVYIDMAHDGDDEISAGDIRLTESCCGGPNSKVGPHDGDEGDDIAKYYGPDAEVFMYLDINDNGGYDLEDPAYLDLDENKRVSTGDIRLTDSMGYLAWSVVELGDDDYNEPLYPIGEYVDGTSIIGYPGSTRCLLATVDVDCDDKWSCPDKLYLQQPSDQCIFNWQVTIGDIRLYIPENDCVGVCGTKVEQCSKDAVYALRVVDMAARIGWDDIHNDDIYNFVLHGEAVYIDMDNDGKVSDGDVRLTETCTQYDPNTKVGPCDRDIDHPLDFKGQKRLVTYVEMDGEPGYSLGDPLYLDMDKNKRVSVNDVRLSMCPLNDWFGIPAGGIGPAYSVVIPTDYDAENNWVLKPLLNGNGTPATPKELLGYIDSDCSLSWTCPDKLYLQQLVQGFDQCWPDEPDDMCEILWDVVWDGEPVDEWCGYVDDPCRYNEHVTIGDFRIYINETMVGPGPGEPCWIECGTKVEQCDVDMVYALRSLYNGDCTPVVKYHDEDSSGDYSSEDGVYIDMDCDGRVSSGDVRLSDVCGQMPPNTKVGEHPVNNPDLDDDLEELPYGDGIVIFADINGNERWDIEDPLYLDMDAVFDSDELTWHQLGVTYGDIRLTDVPVYDNDDFGPAGSIGAAWTRVKMGDDDAFWSWWTAGQVSPWFIGEVHSLAMILDADCSQTWTCPDKLYLQQKQFGFVTAGDLRLYIPSEDNPYNPYDTNENCKIEMGELAVAIEDWYSGSIEMGELAVLIEYWYAGSYC